MSANSDSNSNSSHESHNSNSSNTSDTKSETQSRPQPRSCPYCLKNFADPTRNHHPLWVYMVTINEEGQNRGAINCTPQLGLTRNPLVRLNELNRVEGFRPGSKNSLAGAPYWQVELAIGPFCKGGGAFKQAWLEKSRTALRRFVYGILLAEQWNTESGTDLVVYARNKDNTIKLMREEAWSGS